MKIKSKNKFIGALLGTIVEYYDYSLYGFSAAIITEKFFSNSDPMTALIKFYTIYAMAYLAKPIGALIFGQIGDTYGRKTALSITIIGIALPTMMIGLLPEYRVIGIWSTMILVLCKFAQGIFSAGEYDGAAIYVIEHVDKRFQSTASAITRCTGVLGMLLAISCVSLFKAPMFPAWGWRIPFLLSLPLAYATFCYRQKFEETPAFTHIKNNKINIKNLIRLFQKQWRSIITVIGLAGSFGGTYQIAIIFMPEYLSIMLPKVACIKQSLSICIVFAFAICMPIAGFIADRMGLRIVIQASVFGTIVASIALIAAIEYEMVPLALTAALIIASCVAPFNALTHGIIIPLFSVNERYRAVSFGHTIGSILISGSTNIICMLTIRKCQLHLFPIIYLSSLALLYYYIIQIAHRKQPFAKGNKDMDINK